jgi:hypothetical protein
VEVTGLSQLLTYGLLIDGVDQVTGGAGENEARLGAGSDLVLVTAAGSFLTSGDCVF